MSCHHLLALLAHSPLATPTRIPLRIRGTPNSACASQSLASTSATAILPFFPGNVPRILDERRQVDVEFLIQLFFELAGASCISSSVALAHAAPPRLAVRRRDVVRRNAGYGDIARA